MHLSPEEQLAILTRGTERLISPDQLLRQLHSATTKKQPLRVKMGVDPTAPDIHLGHCVGLLKLRQFQDLGHTAVLIIGDFTASIGDPSGRNTTRPTLSRDTILANAHTYQEQAFKILRRDQTEVVWNGTWFNNMTAHTLLELLSRRSVSQILQREDFKSRLESHHPLALHEICYPLLQGWDSVMVKADVEIGGSDQLFNLLIGRDLQEQCHQPPQTIITLPLLEGTDGVHKMSKSLGNTISVNDPPKEMFGRVMSIPDPLTSRWSEILFAETPDPSLHPMEAKKRLAQKIITLFHSASAAQQAREEFERIFSLHQLPTDLPSLTPPTPLPLTKLLVHIHAAPSNSEARRLILAGAVSINQQKITDPTTTPDYSTPFILRCGKRFFAQIQPPPHPPK
ncbi:MAG: tyrosine--tRNA ligase [Verrucomicrobiae bacterium]|nr:tyrosine--tRNA ligase [Verrucomicrobiae bacterium]